MSERERGELVMIVTPDGDEPGRLYAIPERLIPFLEALRDGAGVFGSSTEGVIEFLLSERIAALSGTPLLSQDLVDEKRRALRTRGQGAALW